MVKVPILVGDGRRGTNASKVTDRSALYNYLVAPPDFICLTRMMPDGVLAQFCLWFRELTDSVSEIQYRILGILGQRMDNKMPLVIN